jgi:hypothetical protein
MKGTAVQDAIPRTLNEIHDRRMTPPTAVLRKIKNLGLRRPNSSGANTPAR